MAEKEEEIEQSIAFLEKKSCQGFYRCCCKTIEMFSELETKKRELDTITEYQTKGVILRSKSRWYNEGGKKYKILS